MRKKHKYPPPGARLIQEVDCQANSENENIVIERSKVDGNLVFNILLS